MDHFRRWLEADGWHVALEVAWADIAATRDDHTLVAEAKGTTTSVGLDVDTAYGQLLRRVRDLDSTTYALVVPREAVRAALRVPEHVLAQLKVSVFSVDDDGTVRLEGGVALQCERDRGRAQACRLSRQTRDSHGKATSMDLGQAPATRLDGLSSRRLLQLYADILTELIRRGVVRSRNAPAGDLGEYLVATALDGELAPPSEKSWDVRVDDRHLQVKVRLIAAGDRRSHSYSPFRSWNFDSCIFLILDAHSYGVTSAVEVPVEGVQTLARETTWVKGYRVGTRVDLRNIAGAIDRTAELRHALETLT